MKKNINKKPEQSQGKRCKHKYKYYFSFGPATVQKCKKCGRTRIIERKGD